MEGLEPVRKRPGMYIGGTDERALHHLASEVLILLVRIYQVLLGPFLGGYCRFTPSCSRYFIEAVDKHGPWKGGMMGVIRLCKCHPFHPGGHDPP